MDCLGKSTADQDGPHLPNLVRLGRAIRTWLQVDDLRDALFAEDMMTASLALGETEVVQEPAEGLEANRVVGSAGEHSAKDLVVAGHTLGRGSSISQGSHAQSRNRHQTHALRIVRMRSQSVTAFLPGRCRVSRQQCTLHYAFCIAQVTWVATPCSP